MDLIISSKNRCCIILLISFLAPFVISSDVDFSKIPQCAIGGCFPYHSSSIGCTQLTTSCFCDALAPINCASKNCTGNDWYAMENWFATQCPNPPNVTLSGLPECSRACFRSAIIPTYCEAQITRTCFCRLETEFEGMSECLNSTACDETATDANNTLVDYYRETCVYDPTVDGEGGLDGDTGIDQGDQVVNAPSGSGSSLDRLALGVGLASGFVALVGAVFAAIKCLHRHTDGGIPFGEVFDPPPPPYNKSGE